MQRLQIHVSCCCLQVYLVVIRIYRGRFSSFKRRSSSRGDTASSSSWSSSWWCDGADGGTAMALSLLPQRLLEAAAAVVDMDDEADKSGGDFSG